MPGSLSLSREVQRAFFASYGGRLKPIQEQVLALLKEDEDGLVIAQTGSGKTEAVLAPVAQRLLSARAQGKKGSRALVISPTRALASDLHRRMAGIFESLGLRMDVATSDKRTVGTVPTDVLIKTPEGLDIDCCHRSPWLAGVGDVVVDEIHAFLDNARGTQIAGLLTRLEEWAPEHRRLGISATVPDTSAPGRCRILRHPVIVRDPTEAVPIEVVYVDWLGKGDEAADRFVAKLSELDVRKAIGFVGRKARAEQLSHLLDRGFLRGKCFPHHADVSSSLRRRTEELLRKTPVALVVATTTLELGLDIGNVDTCILFDAPRDRNGFLQRAGRSGRRSGRRRVVCVPKLYDRRLDFAAVVTPSLSETAADCRPFLAGCVQQILSLLIQLEEASFEAMEASLAKAFGLDVSMTVALLSQLQVEGWIQLNGSKIVPTEKLKRLHETRVLHLTFSVGGGTPIVDETSGKRVGRAEISGNEKVLLGGKGRKIKRIDTNTGVAIAAASSTGVATFASGGLSVFERLARKYAWRFGRHFRV